MTRERHVCWEHLGFDYDVSVYSVGGSVHWAEVRSIETGELMESRKFCGRNARYRAIEHAGCLTILWK